MGERISVEEHARAVRALLPTRQDLPTEHVPLRSALGRVTAIPVPSPVDLPLFTNSQMDGFAVRASDVEAAPITLPIAGEIPARGGNPPELQAGTSVRIMTGAVVPRGADAVVPVEDTTVHDGRVTVHRGRAAGEYVRDRGSDLRAGDELLPTGVLLGSRHLAALAAAGLATVPVVRRVRVVIVTTGAELIEPGRTASLGEVYDSNGIALESAARACGADVTHVIRSDDDDARSLRDAIGRVVADADVLITSGGISMGNFEVVRDFLSSGESWIGTVAMQPGGPQATGAVDGVPVISFPGNPVSSQISFEVFVAPVLREIAGLPAARTQRVRITRDVASVPGKRQFLRGVLGPGGTVEVVAGPGSHLVAALAAADVLVDIPAATAHITSGELVEVLKL